MKERIRNIDFKPGKLARIEQIAEIVEQFQQQGLIMSARQAYYQFVARGLIDNTEAEYKKFTSDLADARYAGRVDWGAIEDRGRPPSTPPQWDSPADLMDSALASYRLPRWDGQTNYVELWCEKQALEGQLRPLAREYHATLMINKGYSSASAMKQSAERIRQAVILNLKRYKEIERELHEIRAEYGHNSPEWHRAVQGENEDGLGFELNRIVRRPIILYLGDHDPSGEDMVRDIGERLKEFDVPRLKVEKIGLTMAQVKRYNPPPNPAKVTDSRAAAYIEKYGKHSWELDALSPPVLRQLVHSSFAKYVNKSKMDAIKQREEADKALLLKAVASIMKKR